MACFSDAPVGCDIEEIRDLKQDISDFVFSESEKIDGSDFYTVWTKKESYLKYLGTGLSKQMNSFSVKDIKEITEINSIVGYAAAVCSEKSDFHDCHIVELRSLSGKCFTT